jgi:alkanesulfonate monooxygenase SsuD/methylene tetrahydromethanopterin reductase-like flavin-dependent oxidoreductase (luciferase family)
VQKSIPIWIGGHSKAALKRAGQLGDGWHPIGGVPTIPLEPEDVKKDLAVLPNMQSKPAAIPNRSMSASKVRCSTKRKRSPTAAAASWAARKKSPAISRLRERRRRHDELRRAPAQFGGNDGAHGVDGQGCVSESVTRLWSEPV